MKLRYQGKLYVSTDTFRSKARAVSAGRSLEEDGYSVVVRYTPPDSYTIFVHASPTTTHPVKKNPPLMVIGNPSKRLTDKPLASYVSISQVNPPPKKFIVARTNGASRRRKNPPLSVTKTGKGLEVSAVIDNQLIRRWYQGYSRREAMKLFTQEFFSKKNPAIQVFGLGNPPEIVTLKSGYEKTKKSPTLLTFRRFTMDDIRALPGKYGQTFWFEDNQGYARSLRLVSSVKTWKRDPNRYEATFKYGMYESTRMDTEEMLRRLLIPIEQKNPSGDVMSDSVTEVRYIHRQDGQPYKHSFQRGVRMVANDDGSITMYHPTKRIHEEFAE